MSTPALEEGPRPDWPAKAATLAKMAAAGLPVPPGLVIPLDPEALQEPSITRAVQDLLAGGPVIARAALDGEDEHDASVAGLGESIASLTDADAVLRAVRRIAEHRDDPWLQAVRPERPVHDFVILQREVTARWLVVAALLPDGVDYVELHPGGSGALAAGTTPAYAGVSNRWHDAARPELERTLARLRTTLELGAHGLDVELVIDADDVVWIVQARPVVRDLREGWDDFTAELARLGQLDRLEGVLVLDAEHNPAPLSFAHAWLMDWLARTRPAAGRPTVLAGWLYVRTLPRDLARSSPGHAPAARDEEQPPLREVLRRLRDDLIPEGRRRLGSIESRLASADARETAEMLDEALDTFGWMIDRYLGVLVPARSRAAGLLRPEASDPEHALSTRDREAFADVLPAVWDIASPSLADLGWGPAADRLPERDLPQHPATQALLLGEWDDHLFALGLAPIRRVYGRAGALLELHDDVFLLEGPELQALLRAEADVQDVPFDERKDALARFGRLSPPLRIEDGRPVPTAPTARMRGIGIGPSAQGRVARRRDLRHLLETPPEPGEIVVMPALTAQTAVALRDLGVRAVVCAHGGALSHASLMARELGVSALVGCRGALELTDGTPVRIDTRLGRLLVATPRLR